MPKAYRLGVTLLIGLFGLAAPAVADDQTEVGAGDGHDLEISRDVTIAAPLWHDWAKTFVFQWNADRSEFIDLPFGGAGDNDDYGRPGDSRTGGHHIIGVAEAMIRGLSPDFVIAQASAHSTPTSGNQFKVVNWLRAGAILARIDPVDLGEIDLIAAGSAQRSRRVCPS